MVRLNRLAVEGLLSYAERQEVAFSGRTVIVGPNNAGKSNLFRVIGVLSDALLRDRNLPASKISQSGGRPSIEAEISLSLDETCILADFLSCGYNNVNSAIHMIPMPATERLRDSLDSITIKIEWAKMPDGSGDNPDVEIAFPKIGFALKSMSNERFFRAFPIDGDLHSERQRGSVQLNTFLKGILQNDDLKSASKKHLQSNDAVHDPIPFEENRLDFKSRLKIHDLMHRLDIKYNATISLSHVIGMTLAKRTVHVTENRNLVQGEVAETLEELAQDTRGSDGFGIRYNNALLDRLKANNLKHTDTLKNDGSNIAHFLLSLKNSPKRADVERYRTIKKRFRHLFRDQKMDIEPILEDAVVQGQVYGRVQVPRPAIMIAREGLPEHLPLGQVGAGARGVIYLLTAVYGAKDSVVMLDEPGINLHPTMIRGVMEITAEKPRNQILTITHSPDLLRHEMARKDTSIVRIGNAKGRSKIYQDMDKTRKDAKDPRGIERIVDPAVFFAKLAIVVEGESDRAMLGLADRMAVRKPKYNLPLNNIAVVGVCGKYGFAGCRSLLDKYGIPWIILADEDAKDQFGQDAVSWISGDGVEGNGPIYLLKGDLEKFMEETDPDAFGVFRQKTKVVRALEWAKSTLEKNPDGASLPLAEFLDRCLSAASRG